MENAIWHQRMINCKVKKYILGYYMVKHIHMSSENFNLVALNCLPYLFCVIKVFIILFQIKFIRSSNLKHKYFVLFSWFIIHLYKQSNLTFFKVKISEYFYPLLCYSYIYFIVFAQSAVLAKITWLNSYFLKSLNNRIYYLNWEIYLKWNFIFQA